MRGISFRVSDDRLTGTVIYPTHSKTLNPAVLFVHGWSSDQTGYIPRAVAVAKCGAICMTFDLRGHGNSDGKINQFSRADHLKDVISAYDYLASLPKVNKNKIGVVGASYGGYLSSILTSKRDVTWLVLRAPALYKDDDFNIPTAQLVKEDPQIHRQSKISPKDNYALKALMKFTNNIALVQCENDDEIPPQTIENYKVALKNNKNYSYILLSKADHKLSTQEYKQLYINLLSKIFSKWLR